MFPDERFQPSAYQLSTRHLLHQVSKHRWNQMYS